MARRSNSTTANGSVESFDNTPIPIGDAGGNTSDAIGDGLPTVSTTGLGNPADGGDGDSNGNGYGVRADGTPAKKRGRKPGQKNSGTQTRVTVSVSGLEKTLVAIHSGIAAMTRNAVWNIDEKEAQALAEASANVARHYNATLDPKWADIIVLIGLIGTMYAPRIMVTFMKPKAQKSQAQQPVEKAPTDMSFSNLPNIPGVPMTH